jgi:thymidylate synthase (FAD)
MGDDQTIERAARVSYQKGTRTTRDTEALIRYMMRHGHTSPFEQCVITLDMKLPIFVARQFVRHRTQSLNEISGRYSELPSEFYVPTIIRRQSKLNKQGSGEALPDAEQAALIAQMENEADESFKSYRQFLDSDVARETARINLPLSTYTQWQTTMNLHNLFHFLKLRMDGHAQSEAQAYAAAIFSIVREWVPIATNAWVEYSYGAQQFSMSELQVLKMLVKNAQYDDVEGALALHAKSMTAREVTEFLATLGITRRN